MINGLDLFSGIGGLTIALSEWVEPVAYCESDKYAQSVLLSRMWRGELPKAPIWDDVSTLNEWMLGEEIDIIYGGFPCQDVSTAGLRKGLDGERTGLFREAVRLVRECKPKFVFLENVPGIRRFVHVVRGELEALGYDCRDGFFSAAEVGANHIRNRWWLLAHASSERQQQICSSPPCNEGENERRSKKKDNEPASVGEEVADSKSRRLQSEFPKHITISPKKAGAGPIQFRGNGECSREWWSTEPNVGRVANGIPARVDRLRALGNAVVPLQAREAFKILMGIK